MKHVRIDGIGNTNARYFFVLDQPGWDGEEPLGDSRSRKFFFDVLAELSIDANDVFVSYGPARCFTGLRRGKRIPVGAVTSRQCRSHLHEELDFVKPELVVALGGLAYKSVNPDDTRPFDHIRGSVIDLGKFKVVSTYSIRHALYDENLQGTFKNDIRRAITPEIQVVHDWGTMEIAPDRERLELLLEEARRQPFVASDVETKGVEWYLPGFEVTHYGAAWGDGRGLVFDPREHPEVYLRFLDIPQVVHNSAFEGNIYPRGTRIIGDVQVTGYLMDPTYQVGLEPLCRRWLNMDSWKGLQYDWLTWAQRNIIDTRGTFGLWELALTSLSDAERRLHDVILLPSSILLGQLKSRKILIDREYQKGLDEALRIRQREITYDLGFKYNFWGNPNSSPQCAKFLYGARGIPVPKRARGDSLLKHSTSADFLAELALEHPEAALIREYRKCTKLRSNYIYDVDFLRPDIRPVGTVSGRPAGKDGVQTFPRGFKLRGSYLPTRGVWGGGDLSQIELVLVAILSADEALGRIYRDGGDVHAETCKNVLGVVPTGHHKECSCDACGRFKEYRNRAKPLNFLLVYGGRAGMLRLSALKDYNILFSYEEAVSYRNGWFGRYAGIQEWHRRNVLEGLATGQIVSPLGQRYPLGKISEEQYMDEEARHAHNWPVQGAGSHLNMLGLIAASELDPDAPVLPVHDAVYNDLRPEDAKEFCYEWKKLWQQKIDDYWPIEERYGIPIKMDVKMGPTLLEVS